MDSSRSAASSSEKRGSVTKILLFFKLYVLPLGGLGIFAVTFLDSTFVPLPSVMDLTFVGFCIARRDLIPYYCLMAISGSVAGCYVLFTLSRRGSRLVKIRSDRARRITESIGKYGGLALIIASLMPPPFPFKLFVLASGLFPITPARFLLAVAAGRGFRFIFQGVFAYLYGDAVIDYMRRDFASLSLIVAAILAALFALSYLAKRRFLSE